ncbi:MAG: hypothetical protein QOG94_1681 [Solirubrobacteraceae bacterium]|jgi:uncharacterized protein YxjI|nr:hypothetical protein [Solirubrobacteraceae bacterium]
MSTPIDPNAHDRFQLRQRIKLVVNQYEFYVEHADGSAGEKVCFVEQKRFKFKEDIRFYTDESKTQELLRIKARQAFDPRATYDVTDDLGAKIGAIQKVFGASLLRSTYRLLAADGEEVAIATEKSMAIAILRRAVGFIPYVDNVADWLPIPYHFVFKRGEQIIGENTRQAFKIRDVYHIDMSADADRVLDRRLVLALSVGMDALQAR